MAHGRQEDLNTPVISSWPDKESAKEELLRIWKALNEGCVCYQAQKQL